MTAIDIAEGLVLAFVTKCLLEIIAATLIVAAIILGMLLWEMAKGGK
ncbi:MAG: hypothetical protein PW734_06805 [Verrucomicrobium sp.]|nr:hypothetical protein [Verrucomicrobium sp.]